MVVMVLQGCWVVGARRCQGVTRILPCSPGVRSVSKAPGAPARSTVEVTSSSAPGTPVGQALERGGELGGGVAEGEAQLHLLGHRHEGLDGVGVHAHARPPRCGCAAAPSAISDWSMPGTPTASKITGSVHGAAQHGRPDALHDGAGDAEVGPAVVRRALGGVDDLVGPEGLGQPAPGGREVGGQHRPVAAPLERGDDGQPDRPAADDEAGLARGRARPGPRRARPRPAARSAPPGRCRARRAPGAAAAPGAPCARPARPGRGWSSRSAPRRSGPR